LKVLIDTNIFVSAIINSKGIPAQVIRYCLDGKFTLVSSRPILDELKRVLNLPRIKRKYRLTDEKIKALIKSLLKVADLTGGKYDIHVIEEDPSDNKFLECALEGKAGYIVSGDKHLLKLKVFRGIGIVTPGKFLEKVRNEN